MKKKTKTNFLALLGSTHPLGLLPPPKMSHQNTQWVIVEVPLHTAVLTFEYVYGVTFTFCGFHDLCEVTYI